MYITTICLKIENVISRKPLSNNSLILIFLLTICLTLNFKSLARVNQGGQGKGGQGKGGQGKGG